MIIGHLGEKSKNIFKTAKNTEFMFPISGNMNHWEQQGHFII